MYTHLPDRFKQDRLVCRSVRLAVPYVAHCLAITLLHFCLYCNSCTSVLQLLHFCTALLYCDRSPLQQPALTVLFTPTRTLQAWQQSTSTRTLARVLSAAAQAAARRTAAARRAACARGTQRIQSSKSYPRRALCWRQGRSPLARAGASAGTQSAGVLAELLHLWGAC